MSPDYYHHLIHDLCEVVGLPDAESVMTRQALEVEGFEILLGNYETDPDALYLICSLATEPPVVRAWHIRDGAVAEIVLEPS